MSARVEHLTTSGTFSLDGQTFEVDNNVWIVGDDRECIVIDAPHDPDAITEAVAGRDVRAIVATHAHDDHIRHAPALAARVQAPVLLHPADAELWRMTHQDGAATSDLSDGQRLEVAGTELHVLHTPGHTPGSVCLYAPDLATVFTGDTLFNGGPGATGRSYSDFPTIIDSIRDKLLALPPDTRVLTGHGDSTTIGDEAPHLHEWIRRGS
ncbi:glyoxylase-like metal-dependent hydrolase (beta-lactamase superfamily II) [Kineococcus xinjiangensis]|uniref:Glyoxylase-like metal-dependent hydrolase (Beta-lactamase superfamily II) n=1 Tax=Kineococcus xinjiangensis TaxID=512762 RepID=A0A2S6IWV6_9ACTN|nr:MBL fold metallo-hydrolase [Kineococcus xinjiangensis]PPK98834.1 glyoxylase-like metal-dependent hydrolase (beta-lactamase superfamily II) [Kineococcus xinjiangensis]